MKEQNLFLLDTLLDALMVMMALRLVGEHLHPLRVLTASLMGAAAATVVSYFSINRAVSALLWLPIAMSMMSIAGGKRCRHRPLRSAFVLLAAAGLLGGTMQALLGATDSLSMALVLGSLASIGTAAAMRRARRSACDVHNVRVLCSYKGRQIEFEAMVDSGNCLRDYLTHRPVIILPEAEGRRALGLETAPLRPIAAQTAGGRMMMWCFVPEQVVIQVSGKRRAVQAVIAFSSGFDGMALLPQTLLEE